MGVQAWGELGNRLPVSPLLSSPAPVPPLSSSLLSCVGFLEFGLGVDGVRDVTGRGHGVMRQGGMQALMGAKVTGADPPSLTARMPSPRPLRLRSKK